MQISTLIVAALLAVVAPQSAHQQVHDFANLLSPADRQSLEQLALDVEKKTTAQMAIVTVKSLDGLTMEEYAHTLFDQWGIGNRQFNNGVLFLIAPNEHRMRIETGRGIEPLLPDSRCGELADEHVVPHFQRGDFAGGIKDGTNALAKVILSDPAAARGDPNSGPVLARTARSHAIFANYAVAFAAVVLFVAGAIVMWRRLYSTVGFATISAIAVSIIAIAAYLVWRTPRPEKLFGWFGGATSATVAAWVLNLTKYRRYGPHGCSKCGTQLQLLSEQEEDPKLSSVQQLEEKIGSVDYDVWICPACLNNDTERYVNSFSSFRDCPKCKARTYKEDPQRTVVPATTISSGSAEIEGRCVSCNYKSIRKITLPMIVLTSSSSSGSSGGGSFGGSFGGGGGGSGGGSFGGFGGGSSSGGGASRGW
jgi:uncharacterized protein